MIVKTPDMCGGRARIDGTRLSVRFIVEARRGGYIYEYPEISQQMINEAIKYYQENKQEIENEIKENKFK